MKTEVRDLDLIENFKFGNPKTHLQNEGYEFQKTGLYDKYAQGIKK